MKRSIRLLAKITPIVGLVLLCFTFGCQQQAEEAITEEQAKAIEDRYVEARNEVNLVLLDEIMDSEIVVHDDGYPEDIFGLEALKNYYTGNHKAFPDFHATIDEMIVKGDKIVVLWTITGTNTGSLHTPFGELPPTGKKVRFSGVAIDRVVNGKVVEEWVFWNVLDILQQLGFTLTPPQVEEPQ